MDNKYNDLFDEHEPEDDGLRISYRDYEPPLTDEFMQSAKKTKFEEWERRLTNAPNYPNNNESRLAIQTLKTCIVETPINNEIARNGYALFDYVMFCYFIFRAHLCADFPRHFVELYDTYVQNLLSLYIYHFFDIPQETTGRMIISRANEYESVIRLDNAVYQAIAKLTQYIEKDLESVSEYDGVLITDFFKNYELHLQLFDLTQTTLIALKQQTALTLRAEIQKSNSRPDQELSRANREFIHEAVKKYEDRCKKEEEAKRKKENLHKAKIRIAVVFFTLLGLLLIYFVMKGVTNGIS